MADVLASTYRFVRETGKEDQPYERVILHAGDKASNLPNDVKAELKKQGLVVDSALLDKNNQRIPGAVVAKSSDSEDEKQPDTKKQTDTKTSS